MKRLSLFFVCLLLWSAYVFAQTGATERPDHLVLTWTGDTATTMTISWRTSTAVKQGTVQYNAGNKLAMIGCEAEARYTDLHTDLGTIRLFTAKLTGLKANTRYTYCVGAGQNWSAEHTFTTTDPRADTVKFLVFGDSQSIATGRAPYAEWRTTVRNAFKAHPDARFMVNVGDLVDTGESCAHWNAWFAAAAGVIDAIPVMPVLGNHDTYKGGGGIPYWNAHFRLPQNGPATHKNQTYSYDVGPLHLVALDSQQGEQRATGDILNPQRKWLTGDLAAAQGTWKIAFFHKSPYGEKAANADAAVRSSFCPILEQHKVNVVFSGHDHGIARTHPLRNGAKTARGTVYYTSGRSGIKKYADLQQHPLHSFFYNPVDQPNYLVVEATETTLTVTAVKQDGTVVDRYTITK